MPSFGEELRRERELREISLREISEATKINMRFLEALERNEFSGLPGGVFNKGYVRAYCQHIGVDPEGMVNAYLLEEQAQSARRAGAGAGVDGLLRGRRDVEPVPETVRAEAARRLIWIRVAIAGGVVVAVIGLAYLMLRSGAPGATP